MAPLRPLSGSGAPRWSSSNLMRRVIAGCERWSWPAARVTPPRRAIETKVSKSCRFISHAGRLAISKTDITWLDYALDGSKPASQMRALSCAVTEALPAEEEGDAALHPFLSKAGGFPARPHGGL